MAYYSMGVASQSVDNLAIVGIYHAASPATRPRVYELVVGGVADGGNASGFHLFYHTTTPASGSTAVAPSKLNPDSQAADAQGAYNNTLVASPTTQLMHFGLNQRVLYRWVARQGREFVFGATVAHGIHLQGDDIGTAFSVGATIFFEE